MLIDPDGQTVYLEKGEPIPVFCDCGKIYSPTLGTSHSVCEGCGAEHIHVADPDVAQRSSFLLECVPWALLTIGAVWVAARNFLGIEY